MLISKTVMVKWHSKNKRWYQSKGYIFTKFKDEFEVKVSDLSNGSSTKVQIKCDCKGCKNPYLKPKEWYDYKKSVHEDGKYYCHDCAKKAYNFKDKRQMSLEELPRWGKHGEAKEGSINWRESVGCHVKFIYGDINGELQIIGYNTKAKKNFINVKYENNKILMSTGAFSNCKLGSLIGKNTKKYKFNIGDIIKCKSVYIKIIKQIRIPHGEYTHKGYIYECLNCHNIDEISESNLNNGVYGCNVCCPSPTKVLKDYNDLWTTHPNIASMLKNRDIGYRVSKGSNIIESFICPICGNEINNKSISTVVNYGIACHKCGDGISFPNKLMFNILEQLNISFETEFSPKWCKYIYNNELRQGKYDFYFKLNNKKYIIEMDGGWHKKDNNLSGQTKEKSKEIDDCKDLKAEDNSIEVIRIDCEFSNLEFIKNNIMDSKLSELSDLSNMDWNKCLEYAYNSMVKVACDLWVSGIESTISISKITKLHRSTIIKYLKQGIKLNWCKYDAKYEMTKSGYMSPIINPRKIICLNTKEVFESTLEAVEKYNIDASAITKCCRGKLMSVGIHLITGERLVWMYYENYVTATEEDIRNKLRFVQNKIIICLTTNEKFQSITEASERYEIKSMGNIAMCCDGKRNYSGKDPITGIPLRWMRYYDYINLQEIS